MKTLHISSLILLSALSVASAPVLAETKITAIEGVAYDIDKPMADNVQTLVGKKVTVTLHAGGTMTGLVKDANNILLHLEKLEGKEYFDALILVKDISAIETRYRMPAR